MKKNYLVILFLFFYAFSDAQLILNYYSGAKRIDSSQVNKEIKEEALRVNRIYRFINDSRNYLIKVMNVNGKTYAQSITERVYLSHDNIDKSLLFRKVENLTNVKIEDGEFISDQLKARFAYVKEAGRKYRDEEMPPIQLMICSQNVKAINCRINDDDFPIEFSGRYPEISYKRLNYNDLNNKKLKDLKIMKAEIYARYGYNFPEKELKEYFYKQGWYEPVAKNEKIEITELEEDNLAMISVFENEIPFIDMNNTAYDQILDLGGVVKSSLYNKGNPLRTVKTTETEGLEKRCLLEDYNKQGILNYKEDCTIKKQLVANYFGNNKLVQHLTNNEDAYFYYNKEGIPVKKVILNYDSLTTKTSLYTYEENKIIKAENYLGNKLHTTEAFEYDENENLIKTVVYNTENKVISTLENIFGEISRGVEEDPQGGESYVYGDIVDPSEMLEENVVSPPQPVNLVGKTGVLKDNKTGCDYMYNNRGDIIVETKCFKMSGGEKKNVSTQEIEVLKEKRNIDNTLSSAEVRISDQGSLTKKEYQAVIDVKYY